jgi:hypothetical protein
MVVARGSGEGNYYLIDTEFQFCKMKRVLGVDSGDGCTIMYVLTDTVLYI